MKLQTPHETSFRTPLASSFFATILGCALPIAAGSALSAVTVAQESLTIKCGKLISAPGKEMKDAIILIENGKIKSVASGTEVPWESKVIDASDKVVMPTYVIAHTNSGMDGANERMVNVPYITVQDGVDPAHSYFEGALRNGVGTIHVIPGNATLLGGTGMVVKPYGKTVEEMAVRASTGLKMSLQSTGSRMAQIQKMRRALEDIMDYIKDYERRKKEFENEKAAGATTKKEFEEKIDPKKKPVVDLLQGKARAYFYVPSAAEVFEAIRLIDQYKLDVVLVLGPRCHKAAADLAKIKTPIVLDVNMEIEETNRDTDETTTYCLASLLTKAGKEYALSIGGGSGGRRGRRGFGGGGAPPNPMANYPWWQMAAAVRNGVSRDDALHAMTLAPAKMLGLDGDVGSIEAGKVANIQILTGDPLKATTWVETVILDGEIVYERSKDRRLQHLFGQSTESKTNR